MRRGRDPALLRIDDVVVGVNLSADYVAEHEWGIRDLAFALGIPVNAPAGAARRRCDADRLFDRMTVCEGADSVLLFLNKPKWTQPIPASSPLKVPKIFEEAWWPTRELRLYGEYVKGKRDPVFDPKGERTRLAAAWCERDCAVLAFGEEEKRFLRDLVAAIQNAEPIVVWRGGGGPFLNAGLCIAIESRLPPEVVEGWRQFDEEADALQKADKATGIRERLKAAKKDFFALAPRKSPESPGGVIYWLNPCEQQHNNSGWFTVEDLDAWIRGEGRIPKKEKVK